MKRFEVDDQKETSDDQDLDKMAAPNLAMLFLGKE
jgi:hypothetical protein